MKYFVLFITGYHFFKLDLYGDKHLLVLLLLIQLTHIVTFQLVL